VKCIVGYSDNFMSHKVLSCTLHIFTYCMQQVICAFNANITFTHTLHTVHIPQKSSHLSLLQSTAQIYTHRLS